MGNETSRGRRIAAFIRHGDFNRPPNTASAHSPRALSPLGRSQAEAAAFQRVCRKSFERSLAGDQLNPVRTSHQCWCNFPGCFTDPQVREA